MKTRFVVLIVMISLLLLGPGIHQAMALIEITVDMTTEKAEKVESLKYLADNVIILFDSSDSMKEPFKDTGMTKLQASKKLLKQRVGLFPHELSGLNVGLYSYTPPQTAPVSSEVESLRGIEVFYELQPLNKSKLLKAVDSLPDQAFGPSYLQKALSSLRELLHQITGRTVVFIFSDGNYDRSMSAYKPVTIAKELAEKYDVNFQIISTTDKGMEEKMLEAVASVGAPSWVIPLETMIDRPEAYSGAVFILEESYIYSAESSEKVVGFILDHILFDFGQTDITMESTEELKAVAKVLKDDPDSYVVLSGFTDSQGPAEYNLMLSEQRVKAVAKYLATEFNIDKSRIMTFWYGEEEPIADNNTADGRKKNRRVLGFIVVGK